MARGGSFTLSSSTPVTVTACATLQFEAVKLSAAGETVATRVSPLSIATDTVPKGRVLSTTA